MYEKFTDSEKRRYWITLSAGVRADYLRIEAFLHGLADSPAQQAWRELWRPV